MVVERSRESGGQLYGGVRLERPADVSAYAASLEEGSGLYRARAHEDVVGVDREGLTLSALPVPLLALGPEDAVALAHETPYLTVRDQPGAGLHGAGYEGP
jgi:hypothetical protein